MTQTLDSKDLIAVHKKLSNCWEMSDISYRNIDLGSTKRQKNSYADSQLGESKNAMNSNDTKNGNFPRMTRVQSKNYGVPSMSKDSDMILGNPMDSQYNASLKDNQSVNGEQAVRLQFAQSLLDAFVTKDEEYDQFKQNDEKQYEDDDDWRLSAPIHQKFNSIQTPLIINNNFQIYIKKSLRFYWASNSQFEKDLSNY